MPTVLVIEDEPEVNDLLRVLLDHFGYGIIVALTGAAGLELATRHKPDLIMLDLGLPDMSGIEVIKELRSWSAAPLLVLSDTSRPGSRADAEGGDLDGVAVVGGAHPTPRPVADAPLVGDAGVGPYTRRRDPDRVAGSHALLAQQAR